MKSLNKITTASNSNITCLNLSAADSSLNDHKSTADVVLTQSLKFHGKKLMYQQFLALTLQRLHHYRRNMRVLLTNVFLPCIFVALSMGFTLIRPKLTKQISLEMTPAVYDDSNIFIS